MKRPKREYGEHILPYLERVEKYCDQLEEKLDTKVSLGQLIKMFYEAEEK